jgi:AmiR/NasT family two-component response regulator
VTETVRAAENSLHELVDRLRVQNAQLERALESRIVIEQAKGVLAERYALSVDAAFDLLRRAARSNRVSIHDLAGRVVAERSSPLEITLTRAKAVSARR